MRVNPPPPGMMPFKGYSGIVKEIRHVYRLTMLWLLNVDAKRLKEVQYIYMKCKVSQFARDNTVVMDE